MNANFARWCRVWLGVVLLAGAGVARGDWPVLPEDMQQRVISLKEETPVVRAVRENLAAALAMVKPEAAAEMKVSATAAKGHLVWGDLFQTGSCYALYEPRVKGEEESATLALAEWQEGKWELRGLWRMPLDWVPSEDRWSGNAFKQVERDTLRTPWELEDLIGDAAPEVIVAGEKMKYHQVRYVMKFDKESRGLELLALSMAKPVKAGRFLRTYDASGNKAVWQEWTFLEWKEGKLEERAAWHYESPYNNIDPAFYEARAAGADGKVEKFRATMGNGEEGNVWSYVVEKDGKPFAKLRVNWMPEKSRENADLMEGAWLFEKLTGLAREDFPERHGRETAEKAKLGRLEDSATVEVEPAPGIEAARERFSGGK